MDKNIHQQIHTVMAVQNCSTKKWTDMLWISIQEHQCFWFMKQNWSNGGIARVVVLINNYLDKTISNLWVQVLCSRVPAHHTVDQPTHLSLLFLLVQWTLLLLQWFAVLFSICVIARRVLQAIHWESTENEWGWDIPKERCSLPWESRDLKQWARTTSRLCKDKTTLTLPEEVTKNDQGLGWQPTKTVGP